MTGWLEASWWNVAAVILPVLGACLAIRLALKRPAGGEPPASPRSGARSPLPGLIPPAPTSHSCGGVARLIDIRQGGCIWIWRRGHGWQQAAVCIPSETDWDEWLSTLPLEDT